MSCGYFSSIDKRVIITQKIIRYTLKLDLHFIQSVIGVIYSFNLFARLVLLLNRYYFQIIIVNTSIIIINNFYACSIF